MNVPHDDYEKEYRSRGHPYIAGIDEVGMGCLAGPVVAAAVIFAPDFYPAGLNDSKLLSPKKRELMTSLIKSQALAFSIASASVDEIDTLNIYQAARLAMKRAVSGLSLKPTFLLIDGRATIDCGIPQLSLIKGDQKSVSIAAASIIAKVLRDSLMTDLDARIPGYDFSKHKGYGSVLHRMRLGELGRSPIHRKTFSWTPIL